MSIARSSWPRAAFSLIELLVVLAIIGLVAVFAIPAASNIILGTELTRGSQVMGSLFGQARQTAITRNHLVEVRLIKYADPNVPAESLTDSKTWKYRAVQLMEILPNGAKIALQKPERLPGSVQMNDGVYSSLINGSAEIANGQAPLDIIDASVNANTTNQGTNGSGVVTGPKQTIGDTQPEIPGVKRQYQYVAFHYLPDGSTDLKPTGRWYVTLLTASDQIKLTAQSNGAAGSGGADPIQSVNYFTLQVDPVSGATRSFRPSISPAGAKPAGT